MTYVASFESRRLAAAEKKLRQLAAYPKAAERLADILAYYGIRFVVVEPLHGARIDGAAFWIGESPVIAVSARWDRIDAFWFTVMHEFMHLKTGDAYSVDVDLVSDGEDGMTIAASDDEAEQRANDQAADALVPKAELESFIKRTSPLYAAPRIVQFAHRIRMHPGIIVGQLQHRGELRYSAHRAFLSKIRQIRHRHCIDRWLGPKHRFTCNVDGSWLVATKKKLSMMIGATRKQMRTDREMEYLLEKFIERHPDHEGPFDPDEICGWALDADIYHLPPPPSPREQLKRRFSRHLNHRYLTDPQNREVRALHAVPFDEVTPDGVKHGYRYYPLFTTEPEKIKLSLSVRRSNALSRVIQIENDRLSYNDNNIFGATIEQMSFDFDTTLAERSMPTTYSDIPPEGIDDEDDKGPT